MTADEIPQFPEMRRRGFFDEKPADHAAEARKHIEWAHEQQGDEGQFDYTVRDNALLAQAEATLALVEQQRIANLIAYAGFHVDRGDKGEIFIETKKVLQTLREVAEGLGVQ